MLLTKEVEMKWVKRNKSYYINKGYIFTKLYDLFLVNVNDLPNNSNIRVDVKCDNVNCKNPYLRPRWAEYLKYVRDNNKYYCRKCACSLYGGENKRLTTLKNGKSFEQWCLENNRQDVIDRWDYKLNEYKPNEINYSSNKKYYLKCPNNLHHSELKLIGNFTMGQEGSISCNQCNSFAQWGINNLGEDFLEKYWDYAKNNKLNINPWEITYGTKKYFYIKCQNKNYHDSYKINGNCFIKNARCPYCNKNSRKIHPLDSLGTLYPKSLEVWSTKNKKSSYEYSSFTTQEVWWKCPDGIHEDFKRKISNSNLCNFRCPDCQYSQGEKVIEEYLKINDIYSIPQKEFSGLIGINGGNLSYDFYLPQYNLLIEYQGVFHDCCDGKGTKYIKENFPKQQEHDRRKRNYAIKNNIKLLEIWYWDFDNIEQILDYYLNELKEASNL